ncbi:glycosyltransferase family 1 protein [Nostoc sp. FACHB-87]|uniref:glycosyltransferase n=1 Tax=Nostocaceae TaxID=1162 RepID=UPI00168A3524|nr:MULTISPECIES: glycosyltransferase [Nostocaceae]MBD2299854.1 glycosyltransferase family 1 protein [Nostoc sp. FACHB-190]MBD2458372.1 glycosyltransferase family 1 protein [Nostoc sp. FACHB-87]MBD2479534.1 glycosyltransferase family 1 protein [Anabaena sp. FACHB-83]
MTTAIPNSQPSYALISVHGDPTSEVGKEGAGGQNVYVRELGLALAKRGCQIDMFTRREHPNQPEIVELAPGCRTIRLKVGPTEFISRNNLFEYLPEFVEAWLNFQQRTECNYALIHTNYWLSGWVGLELKSRLGLPQVHTYHSIGAVKYRHVQNSPQIAAIRYCVERAILEQADCVISTSPQEVEDLRQLISPSGRIKVIPCGINTEHFGSVSKKVARQQLGIAQDAKIILYVGRFDPRKGIETLVKACACLPNAVQLYLVGGSREDGADFQEQQRIQDLVDKLGLKGVTVFTGRISQALLPAYYAAGDICVVPSYYEPFGLVAIEAMAAGTPVIASDVGGLQHTVVHGETGLLVPPRDPNALKSAIRSLLENPILQESYGNAARKWVQSRFSTPGVGNQIYELYQSLTVDTFVQEVIQNKKLTPDLEKQIQNLLKSTTLKSNEIKALEKLIDSFSNDLVQWVTS